ncbi:MAG: magnesium transporter [Woeseiaceae bacterium]|nr:magnesium transporter [Woeseiaceae bacterium]
MTTGDNTAQDERENREITQHIETLIAEEQRDEVLRAIDGWDEGDVTELLIQLPLRRARRLYDWLPADYAADVMEAMNADLRAVLIESSEAARIADIVGELDEDDAVELLNDLPDDIEERVLEALNDEEEQELRERLKFEEDSAGSVMSNKFVVVLDDWNVGTATRLIRRKAKEIEKFYEAYVVNEERELVGLLKLRDLLLNKKKVLIRDIMRPGAISVTPDADQEDVLDIAGKHKLATVPVVDENNHVIGRITVDEIQEIARDEAEEDMMIMGGVSPDATADDTLGRIVRTRLPWLIGGLFGAALAGLVVGSFEDQLRQAAILATFIPVVMAMAGNAGIQASTVTVQGLATGDLWTGDIGRRIFKELAGSLINGFVVAFLLYGIVLTVAGFVAIEAPQRLALAAALSVALVTAMAATLGSTIPILLDRLKIDPAVATGVFITTSNDILGVFVYFVVASTIYLGAS